MCEWLPNGEWFDVRLLCGGHSFNAHRTVLANVSSFLRKVFLSCPDETPIFIMLPEFDLEAMPFVLYYIYNGEVTVPKEKFKIFLDTANAMEIFIEQRCVTKADYGQYCSAPKSGVQKFTRENYSICCFGLFQENDRCYINVKKDPKTLAHQMRKSVDRVCLHDYPNPKLYRLSEEKFPKLGNLKMESFRRDTFIETYSKENDVNSHTVGMRVMTNQNNFVPAYFLLDDTYQKYPSATDTLSYASAYITRNSTFNAFKQLQLHNSDLSNKFIRPYEVSNQLKARNFNASSPGHNVSVMKQLTDSHFDPRRTIAKVTILNEVLQNPWHPQQPNSYRPFHRKDQKPIESEKHYHNKTYSTDSIDLQLKPNKNDNSESISFDQKELKCSICYKIFKGRQNYEVHLRQHSSGARYSCEECHKTFSQLRNFKYHMSVHRGTKEFATICSTCGKHFNDRGYLSNHMKIHRNRKEYKCTSCPKSFNQRVAFNMHVRIHTGLKPHVCEECGKAFARKMLLKQHQRIHTGERPYACTHCDKRFADRSNMTLHLRLHTGVKPFSCTLCPKSFSKKHHLKSHLNFHTGVKPYSCPQCKLTFTQSSNMRTHFKKCNTQI